MIAGGQWPHIALLGCLWMWGTGASGAAAQPHGEATKADETQQDSVETGEAREAKADDPNASDSTRQDPQSPFRLHEALHAPEWLLFDVRFRTRYSGLQNQFRPGLDDADQALSLRTLLTLGARYEGITVMGELQDARAYLTDENSAVSTIVVNAVELLQAYVNVRLDDALLPGGTLDLRLGRQTLDLGSRRLIARNRFRNTIQSYTGLTSRWRDGRGSELLLMWLLPVTVRPGNDDIQALLDNRVGFDEEDIDLRLWGAWYGFDRLPFDLRLEAYLLGLNEDDDAERATRNRQLYTPGLRVYRNSGPGRWDLDVENTVQFGTRRQTSDPMDTLDMRVRAHFHHVEVGYSLDVRSMPRLSAELDYGSGDRPGTGRYERYDSLYGPRRAEFNPTGIYGPLGRPNTVSTGLRLSVEPTDRLDGFLSWRANLLEEPSDAFSSTGVSDPAGQSGRFAGHQLELRTRLWLMPEQLRGELGGAVFVNGPFFDNAPDATGNGNPLFIYVDLEVFL